VVFFIKPFLKIFEIIGKTLNSFFEEVGKFYVFMWQVVKWSVRRPYRFRLVIDQIEKMGVKSVPIVALSSLSVGMIFALQTTHVLRNFKAEIMVGSSVAMTYGREFAPVMTALMLIAKNGSAIAAELGTMRVTEQIDAMETMSVNPIHYLIVPKMYAALLIFPVLTAISNVIGIFGAWLVSVVMMGVDEAAFFDKMFWIVDPEDIYSGLIKSVALAFIVIVISSYYGYFTKNGAKGVGESTTKAVVASSVSILIADYIMTDLMIKYLFRSYF